MNTSFTSIVAKNFRGFKDVSFSLQDTAKTNKPFIVVYGQNGSGKSSFARLFSILPSLALMMDSRLAFSQMLTDQSFAKLKSETFQEIIKSQFFSSAKDIVDDNKTIGTEGEPMELEYRFMIGQKNGVYRIVFSDDKVMQESLSFRLDSRIETLFAADEHSVRVLNEKVFLGTPVRASIREEHARLFGLTSLLGIVYHFVFSSNEEYRKRNIRQDLVDILIFFSSLSVSVSGRSRNLMVRVDTVEQFYDLRDQDVTPESERIRPALEAGLTAFFSSLSYNLKSVEYRKTMLDNKEVYSLYFNEYHGDDVVRSVPFHHLSSGTRKLLSLFFTLYNASFGKTTVIDEVDNGIHDLIIANILSGASENESGQLIFTTHNTLLMKKLPKSCIHFLDLGPQNETSFYSLDEFGRAVQEKTDVIGRYLDGLYGGAPFPNVPSMKIIKEIMDDVLNKTASEANPGGEA